jgi:hypothetical protein
MKEFFNKQFTRIMKAIIPESKLKRIVAAGGGFSGLKLVLRMIYIILLLNWNNYSMVD